MKIADRYRLITEYFSEAMPSPKSELNFTTHFELLVAVVLSAQCTDKRVNMVTPALFERFPTSKEMAEAQWQEIFEYIKSVSFPNNKAKNLSLLAKSLEDNFSGIVPSTIDELTSLAGVGRKTANVIVSVLFGQPAMAVDTHVFRVSERIGLTTKSATTPLAKEKQLTRHFSKAVMADAHHWLILHGRYVCKARKPMCESCGISDLCKSYKKI